MAELTKGERSRQAILDAAAALVRRQGVQNTSMADIIATSGSSAGAIYHHFTGKQAIMAALAKRTLEWPLDALANSDGQWTPTDLFQATMATLDAAPDVGGLVVQLVLAAVSDDALGHALFEQLAPVLAAVQTALGDWASTNGVTADELPGIIQIVLGMSAGYNMQRLLNPAFDAAGYRARCVRLLASLDAPQSV